MGCQPQHTNDRGSRREVSPTPFFFFSEWHLNRVLAVIYSVVCRGWRFSDGASIAVELEAIDIEKIRAACSQQSRTQWTAIASCDRLYQFIALSDEETQKEMRQTLTPTIIKKGSGPFPGVMYTSGICTGSDGPSSPRGTKR